MPVPTDPIAAVTHPDPYPYYAKLVAERPIHRDVERGFWVVASADAVTEVFTNPECRVRPLAEPVPAGLLGSPAGAIFGQLVRMTDGDSHRTMKLAVSGTLASVKPERLAMLSRQAARQLLDTAGPAAVVDDLTTHVIGSLLGVPDERLTQLAEWMRAFVPSFSPISTTAQIERGSEAAGELLAMLRELSERDLLGVLAGESELAGCHDPARVVANGIGFLWQAHEATAGLIGNTLLALSRYPHLREQVVDNPDLLEAIVREVARYDPPIQNTRRFVASDATIAGQRLRAGEMILVVVAAANRDPSINPNPDVFDLNRLAAKNFTFGAGPHACPGSLLAITIVREVVSSLLAVLPVEAHGYRPSLNARIPIIHWNGSDAA